MKHDEDDEKLISFLEDEEDLMITAPKKQFIGESGLNY
jgi:hypothetical protein